MSIEIFRRHIRNMTTLPTDCKVKIVLRVAHVNNIQVVPAFIKA